MYKETVKCEDLLKLGCGPLLHVILLSVAHLCKTEIFPPPKKKCVRKIFYFIKVIYPYAKVETFYENGGHVVAVCFNSLLFTFVT